jgi:hypothetical protein
MEITPRHSLGLHPLPPAEDAAQNGADAPASPAADAALEEQIKNYLLEQILLTPPPNFFENEDES